MSDQDPIELEPSQGTPLAHDKRPPMPEPPPVRVIAVSDVHLPAATGREAELDAFYIEILKFVRVEDASGVRIYHGENVDLVFDVAEPPLDRDSLVPTPISVPSLRELRQALIEREIDFQPMKGLMPASDFLLLRDPTGNWLAVSEWQLFS